MSQNSQASSPTVKETPAVKATGPNVDTVLQTKNLTKDFGGVTAADEVDFNVENGELRCIIGPNGAGKSTLVNLITGQLKPTKGKVFFDSHDITQWESFERVNAGMSLKFQSPNVYGKLTAKENIRIPLQQTQQPTNKRIVELINKVNLPEDILKKRADSLSHGEQQHLEIAMALALEPKILFLDEPVAGLSTDEQRRIADLVRSLNNNGLTIIAIEHNIDFVENVSDKVTVMHDGRLFREGSIEEIQSDDEVRRIYLGAEK